MLANLETQEVPVGRDAVGHHHFDKEDRQDTHDLRGHPRPSPITNLIAALDPLNPTSRQLLHLDTTTLAPD